MLLLNEREDFLAFGFFTVCLMLTAILFLFGGEYVAYIISVFAAMITITVYLHTYKNYRIGFFEIVSQQMSKQECQGQETCRIETIFYNNSKNITNLSFKTWRKAGKEMGWKL